MTSDVQLTLRCDSYFSIVLFQSEIDTYMKKMIFNTLGIYYTALTFVINFALIASKNALLFDLEGNVLVEENLVKGVTDTRCQKCVIACTANPSERDSVGDRALVVQKVYEKFTRIDEIVLPQCVGTIQTSFMINKKTGFLEIGYEIYDTKNILESAELKSTWNEFLSLYSSNVNAIANPRQVLVDYFKKGSEPSSSEKSFKSFIWVPVLMIDLNIETMSPKAVEYNFDSGIHKQTDDCFGSEAGKEIYGETDHSTFFDSDNQRMIFTGNRDLTDSLDKAGFVCGQKYGCLVRHQIIPPYYMHSNFGAFATCAPVNTVPIWCEIASQINIVDEYLFAMSQIWKSLSFKTGFFEILKPSKKYFKKIPTGDQELFLNQANKELAVPKIVYKIVEYTLTIPPLENKDYYYAVVVIHNDPTADANKQRICEQKSTSNNGWEDIANNKLQSGLTYVCPFSWEVARKLNLIRNEYVEKSGYLKPNNFPVYNATQAKYFYQNKKLEIKQKIEELF